MREPGFIFYVVTETEQKEPERVRTGLRQDIAGRSAWSAATAATPGISRGVAILAWRGRGFIRARVTAGDSAAGTSADSARGCAARALNGMAGSAGVVDLSVNVEGECQGVQGAGWGDLVVASPWRTASM